jgi:hypothetical protein
MPVIVIGPDSFAFEPSIAGNAGRAESDFEAIFEIELL